jgi:uncharacterized protein (DUF2147 family)
MKTTLSLAALTVLGACAPSAAAPAPTGRWLTASGNVEVTIQPCGARLCGDVSRVIANNSMDSPGVAAKVPPAKVGLRVMSDFGADGAVWTGHIYNREQGRTYDCQIRLQGDELVVRAYIGLPLFGRTQIWRRAPS